MIPFQEQVLALTHQFLLNLSLNSNSHDACQIVIVTKSLLDVCRALVDGRVIHAVFKEFDIS